MLGSRRQFVSMRDFLEDLEVRSSVSEKPAREKKEKRRKHKLRNIFRVEENKERDNRYASLVMTLHTPAQLSNFQRERLWRIYK